MSTNKQIDKICLLAALLAVVLCVLMCNGEALGIQRAERVLGYETRLFDTGQVHSIDIRMEDWEGFLQSCENEEYSVCTLSIDGEVYANVGIRAKGNTSLSTVSSLGSQRYSFKVEFDHYDGKTSYHGLDKLCLNNLIQDSTMMKDYLSYQLMNEFGVASSLSSYAYLTVNGEDWGLYLAVEGVEDAFLQRNYGNQQGELYKPESMNLGGGKGGDGDGAPEGGFGGRHDADGARPERPEDAGAQARPDAESSAQPEGDAADPARDGPAMPEGADFSALAGQMPEGFDPTNFNPEEIDFSELFGGEMPEMPGGMGGGMNSAQTKLQYIDDDPDSYDIVFSSAKTAITEADQQRLIASLKALSEGENLEEVLDIDQLLRYFVVHNFVVNGDSYTGSMVHNYYLYEQDGALALIPWDYNLAFGTFQGQNATSAVNDPIDSPLSVDGSGDRPLADWMFAQEGYTQLYHQYFADFLDRVDLDTIIAETAALIAPYVERDPTKFYSTEEFTSGVAALQEFCRLRVQSIRGQLDGSIPATDAGQKADASALVDAGALNLSDMGTMNMGGGHEDAQGGGRPGAHGDRNAQDMEAPGAQKPGGKRPDGAQAQEDAQQEET